MVFWVACLYLGRRNLRKKSWRKQKNKEVGEEKVEKGKVGEVCLPKQGIKIKLRGKQGCTKDQKLN